MDQNAYLFDPRPHGAGALFGYTLPGVLTATMTRHPGALAIVEGEIRLSYSDLHARAEACAAVLHGIGIGRGSVVGVHLANGWPFLVITHAIARLGAVSLPLHPPYRAHELNTLLEWTRATAIVCPQSTLALLTSYLPSVIVNAEFGALLDAHAHARVPAIDVAPNDPLSLNPTSGTESMRPKVCMHAHDGLLSNSRALADLWKYSAHDRVLISGGYTHLFGMAGVQMTWLSGGALIVQPAFEAAAWLDLCEREGVTRAWVAPPQLVAILEEQTARPRSLVLREIRTGGSPIGKAFAARVRATLCEQLTIQWGMSEICGGATTPEGTTFDVPVLGTPIPDADVRVIDGELWYRRADMFRGYFNDPELTAATVSDDGYVRTGDRVTILDDGSLAFEGRTKDVINRGGLKISAYELESLLASLGALRQLAVVAYPDERLGERTALVCSLHPGHSLELAGVTAHLDALGVAKYKWPEQLIVLDALPTTATGKVAKSAVRALVAG